MFRFTDASRWRTALAIGATAAGLLAASLPALADELPGLNGAPPEITDQAAPAPAPSAAPNPNAQPPASPPQNTNAAPAPAASPSAPQPGRRANEGRGFGPSTRHFEHWEVAPTLFWTFSTGTDVIPRGRGFGALASGATEPPDILRITGDARYRFNPRWFLILQRIDHTGGSGRTRPVPPSRTNPLGGTYSGQSEDFEERFLLGDQLNQYLTLRAGYALRTRTCCPGAGDPKAVGGKNLNPRIHTGFFSDIAWRFGPDTIGGKPWTTSFRWEEYVHHPPNPLPKPPAVTDEGVKPTFNFTFYSNFFFYHQTRLVPYYGIEYFSTYFSYSPRMTETYRKVYGVSWRATRDWTNRFYVKNDQSGGVLASSGDSAHKSSLFIESTYRLHW
jgi:hypothetical protein